MWRYRVLAWAGVLHLGSAAILVAQTDTAVAIRAGARVRIDADSGLGVSLRRLGLGAVTGRPGTVVALGPDTVVFRLDRGDSIRNVPLTAIRRLYVSGGPGSRVRDAAIGLVTGAAGGLLFALIMDRALGPDITMDYRQAAAIFAAGGLASGFIFGGQERWRRVPVPSPMRLGGNRRRLSLSARAAF